MSKEQLFEVNKKLIVHFKETGIVDAYYYEPVSETYWNQTPNSKRVAFCNLEPYKKENGETVKGIVPLDKKTLYDEWFYTKTPSKTFALNYYLSQALYYGNSDITEEDIKFAVSKNTRCEDIIWSDFDNSLYFNFRYTCSKTVTADNSYIKNLYKDPFYCQHYRNFVEAADIDILIVGGELGCYLLNKIYPELNIAFKDKPKKLNNMFFVSIEHPSRISYAEMIDVIYDITDAVYKNN